MLYNAATNQTLKAIGFTRNVTTNAQAKISYNASNGQTGVRTSTLFTLAFMYHDSGYLELAPSAPIVRDIRIRTTQRSDEITSIDGLFTHDMAGKFIYADGQWRQVLQVASNKK